MNFVEVASGRIHPRTAQEICGAVPVVNIGTIEQWSSLTSGRVSVSENVSSVTVTFDEDINLGKYLSPIITPFDTTPNSVLAGMYVSSVTSSSFTVSVVNNTNPWTFNYLCFRPSLFII